MRARKDTTGLILAGGAGLRVGGRDKGLLPWRGQPMAARVAARLRPQVGRLLLSCNRNEGYYATLADAIVNDQRHGFQGPLAGIEAAIASINSEFLVIAPCDMPLLPRNFARCLLAALEPDSDAVDISYAHDGDRDQYLCAAIRVSILPSLGAFLDTGQRAVRHWYKGHPHRAVDFSSRAECFANYNEIE